MSTASLISIRNAIQEDVGGRGLATVPGANLITACPDDFEAACRSIAEAQKPLVAVVTGFYIPHAQPPCGETDGPLGAVFLASALTPLGMKIAIVTDRFCETPIRAGLEECGVAADTPLHLLPDAQEASRMGVEAYWNQAVEAIGLPTHVVALERVGPSHTLESIARQGCPGNVVRQFGAEVSAEHHDRCHTMKGRDITPFMSPAHWLLESASTHSPRIATIGIGDGGNEIGMGKIPWNVIRDNIPGGSAVACRVPADYLIVAGISNWGAYGLAAGVHLLRKSPYKADLFDPRREEKILQAMVQRGPLVDGVTGRAEVTVDGLNFDRYGAILKTLEMIH